MSYRVYKILHECWRRELQSPDLGSVPSNIYDEVRRRLAEIEQMLGELQEDQLARRALSEEARQLKAMAEDLFRMRVRKALMKMLSGEPIDLSALPDEEGDTLREVNDIIERALSRILGEARAERREAGVKRELLLVRFTRRCPEFVGIDGNIYGPFEQEDIALLPRENAEALINRGAAVRISRREGEAS